ncbi:hypothetical protein Ancab_001348 [Ancistrocladus abbreviatus]
MGNVDVPKWLEGLPSAPEFRPTDTEFADPIAYISKIEKEASAFGICKVIPPLPRPSKKYVFSNLNKSLSKGPELASDVNLSAVIDSSKVVIEDKGNNGQFRAVFATRQQELGQSVKKSRGACNMQQAAAQKQVWESGELYTLEQFESKSKAFSRSVLGLLKEVSPLVVEALFWKAASEKPIYVEYANDVPGSGFAEPEGLLRYFHGRKGRRRILARKYRGRSDYMHHRHSVTGRMNPCNGEGKDAFSNAVLNSCSESSGNSTVTPTSVLDGTSQCSKQGREESSGQIEGTAGWKLSNSPWNLQVISRSAGSLTRFMLDDIPGVTSPMVYIGMLFSWFAWHVEDHELHSLNFLHTGSSKTWYAVPGDYAYAFEEVIRTQAYGGDIDHLAALKLLGEKTTLLSPQAIVASGIPCCRLVQNPGEFVVTFPRAYHLGFSHGFNCGEAANFGTPQWLRVAKAAAVRRASMDHLPMLSHQQLLYLLTMSFISRVPRSLLPGVRSSRLRDRQKEEREILVKKAFIEDMLKENNLLNVLLGKDSNFYAVLWNPDSLPSCSSEAPLRTGIAPSGTELINNESSIHSENDTDKNNLFDQMNSYVGNMNDLYLDDHDLYSDFQVDSGALECVACGILGFPFMSVIQPSREAFVKIMPADHPSAQITVEVSKSMQQESCDLHGTIEEFVSALVTKVEERWSTCDGFLRPRIFCLEHAVQIEELLRLKGGANMLVICHSDYPKIKANAVAVAEEIGACFDYKEVTLGSASLTDLNLISLAIDNEEHVELREDWTSMLGINLRHCIKAGKSSALKQIEHALKLVGLFSNLSPIEIPSSNIPNINWCSKKTRSKRGSSHQKLLQPHDSIHIKNDQMLEGTAGCSLAGKPKVVIQYSRRKHKVKLSNSLGSSKGFPCGMKHPLEGASPKSGGLDISGRDKSADGCVRSTDANSTGLGVREFHPEVEATMNLAQNSSPMDQVEGEPCTSTTSYCSDFQSVFMANVEPSKLIEIPDSENYSSSPSASNPTVEKSILKKEDMTDNSNSIDQAVDLVSASDFQGKSSRQAGGDLTRSGVSDFADVSTSGGMENMDASVSDRSCINCEVQNTASDDQVLEEALGGNRCNVETLPTCSRPESQSTASFVEDMPTPMKCLDTERLQSGFKACSSEVNEEARSKMACRNQNKRKRDMLRQTEGDFNHTLFVKSPCERLRPRTKKEELSGRVRTNNTELIREKPPGKKSKKASSSSISDKEKVDALRGSYRCDIESCRMHFKTKTELSLHKRNRCPYPECGKRFRSHRYAVLHQRVHDEERPLKCSWKGCTMTFKWAWARTEHMRLHTGERPYKCKFEGCGLTFRFVSDFSRHRRKTGHHVYSSS